MVSSNFASGFFYVIILFLSSPLTIATLPGPLPVVTSSVVGRLSDACTFVVAAPASTASVSLMLSCS